MKKTVCLLLLGLCAILFQGCASGPSYSQVKDTFPVLNPDKGRVYFYRVATLGAAIQPAVRLDGAEVGTAKPKGFFFVDVDPGSHSVETTTEVSRRLTFTVEKNQTRYVRLGVSMGFFVGHIFPELVEPTTGDGEVSTCKYTGGKK